MRRRVVVSPDEVWSPSPPRADAAPEPPQHTFYAPILLVAAISTGLLLTFMAAIALLVLLRR